MPEGLHDIHNPPKVPYKHQDFPMLVYKEPKKGQHPNDAHKLVNDKDELAAALKAGYQEKPYVEEAEEVAAEEHEDGDSIAVQPPAQRGSKATPKPRGKQKKAVEPKVSE